MEKEKNLVASYKTERNINLHTSTFRVIHVKSAKEIHLPLPQTKYKNGTLTSVLDNNFPTLVFSWYFLLWTNKKCILQIFHLYNLKLSIYFDK